VFDFNSYEADSIVVVHGHAEVGFGLPPVGVSSDCVKRVLLAQIFEFNLTLHNVFRAAGLRFFCEKLAFRVNDPAEFTKVGEELSLSGRELPAIGATLGVVDVLDNVLVLGFVGRLDESHVFFVLNVEVHSAFATNSDLFSFVFD
jgi:hypothetical protein